jgi:hypothetical protein
MEISMYQPYFQGWQQALPAAGFWPLPLVQDDAKPYRIVRPDRGTRPRAAEKPWWDTPGEPSAAQRQVALAVAHYCVLDLRLSSVTVSWYGHTDGGLAGYMKPAKPDQIFLSDGLLGYNLVSTVAHEVRHCWQHQSGAFAADRAAREADAADYGRKIAANFKAVC